MCRCARYVSYGLVGMPTVLGSPGILGRPAPPTRSPSTHPRHTNQLHTPVPRTSKIPCAAQPSPPSLLHVLGSPLGHVSTLAHPRPATRAPQRHLCGRLRPGHSCAWAPLLVGMATRGHDCWAPLPPGHYYDGCSHRWLDGFLVSSDDVGVPSPAATWAPLLSMVAVYGGPGHEFGHESRSASTQLQYRKNAPSAARGSASRSPLPSHPESPLPSSRTHPPVHSRRANPKA